MTLVFILMLIVPSSALAAIYRLDNDHTSITFSVKHLNIFTVKGTFSYFDGSFDFDEKDCVIKSAKIDILTETVDTGIAKRDDFLRSPDFLDIKKYPSITFKLKSSRSLGNNQIHAVGDITIRGITKEIALDGEFLGTVIDNVGNERAGVTAHGTLKRGDFGITWNQPLPGGGFMVGEDVGISLEIEGIKNR